MQRAAHGIRVGHLIMTPEGWSVVTAVVDKSDLGYIRFMVRDAALPVDFPTMGNVQFRYQHSDDVGVERITLKDDVAYCPNEGPHVAHTNAIFTDWQDQQSWNCDGAA